jgi:hypothetical protein
MVDGAMKETMKLIDRKIRSEQSDARRRGERGPTGAALAKRMRVDPSMFSRWRVTDDVRVNTDTMTSMQIGYSDDRYEQGELLAAMLTDMKHGPAADLVEVRLKTRSGRTRIVERTQPETAFSDMVQAAETAKLDRKTAGVIARIIAALGRQPAIRRMLSQLAAIADHTQ